MIDLLKADLRATIRNPRWLWISLLLLIALAVISLTWPFEESYLQWAYFYIPPFLTIFTSTSVARDRKSGFISQVFTSPITKEKYFLQKFLFGVSLGLIYLLFTLPISLLHLYYSGLGFLPLLLKYLFSTIILTTFSSALGLFISIISNKDDVMAISLAFVFCVFSLLLFNMFTGHIMESFERGFSPQWQLLYICHFSPYVCILDFLNTHYAFRAVNSVISLLVPILFTAIFLGFSYIFFKKLQNAEGNDFKITEILPIAILLILAFLAPPMFGNSLYSAREWTPIENNPWSGEIIGGGNAIYFGGFGNLETIWWGRSIEIYMPAKGDILHNVTITFLSPESFDLKRLGNQRFIEAESLYFEELEVKKVHNDSFISFPANLKLPSTKVGKGMYYLVASISCDEYKEDLYDSVSLYNGWSCVFLLIITLLLISALLWIFLRERKTQKL
jgi:ABC-type transport system involved in multi-copper enzyme maturation permease subunit